MAKFVQSTPIYVPDQVEVFGNARRIYWHAVYEILDDTTGDLSLEAHYFGTVAASAPMPAPYHTLPVFQHSYVSIPSDMSYLTGNMANDLMYQMGELAGIRRENLGDKG